MQDNNKTFSSSPPVYVVKKRSPWPWILTGMVGAVLLAVLFISLAVNITFIKGEDQVETRRLARPRISEYLVGGEGDEKVAIIPIEGFIGFSADGSMWEREGMVKEVSASLEKAEKDDAVRAVVFRINSPGGGITAADVIHNRIKDFQAEGKKVVALLGDLAASGAYYIACPADLIVAHPTTVTGSFGVIIQSFNLEGLMAKLGIGDVTIKAGDQKDLLSPFRSLSPEERELLQEVVDEMHGRFIRVIAAGRNLEEAEVKKFCDGRIFTASQAIGLKLIDDIGYEEDALRWARELSGLETAQVVEYRATKSLWDLFRVRGGRLFASGHSLNLEEIFQPSSPRLLYLWSY